MDWVRGRPPDALLFLKALVKTASESLSPRSVPLPAYNRSGPTAQAPSHAGPSISSVAATMASDFVNHPSRAPAGTEVERLAEGALLGPLREVGTMAGALRERLGTGLRQTAAAR